MMTRWKKRAALWLCALALLGGLPAAAWADEPADPAVAEPGGRLEIQSKSVILMEQTTGQVLYEENADVQMHPASITKIMTLLLTFEAMQAGQFGLESSFSCSEHAASMGGSQIWLEPGETMTVDELLRATAVSSANDAAVMLAEGVAGSEEVFVAMMNERAGQLGMQGTHFANASGLDAEGHVSTARDIALMSAALLSFPKIVEYSTIWMDTLRGGETQLVNTNKLVRFYKGATGLKTGTTDEAGSCLSASATRDGLSLIAVTLGSDTSDQRFATARMLLDYGFANFITASPPPLAEPLQPIRVLRGTADTVPVEAPQPGNYLLLRGQEGGLTQRAELAADLEAPVEPGQVVGTLRVLLDGEVLAEYPVTAAAGVARMNFGRAFLRLAATLAGAWQPAA